MCLLALGSLFASGCGLGDYEKRLDGERVRVKVFTEEHRALGPPLVMPANPYTKEGEEAKEEKEEKPKKANPLPENEVFLRPPRGIGPRPAADEQPTRSGEVFLFRYPGPEGYNLFLAGVPPGALPAQQFQQDVRTALSEFIQSVSKRPVPYPTKMVLERVSKDPLPSRKVKLAPIQLELQRVGDAEDVENGSQYLLYFHRGPGNRYLAIVYQLPRTALAQPHVSEAINLSLRTLGTGLDAQKQRDAYHERQVYFPAKH
jgi:hypothetical protein